MSTHDARRLLVPVADSVTLRETVAYAVDAAATGPSVEAAEGDASPADAAGDDAAIHFVFVAQGRVLDPDGAEIVASAEDLFERVTVWAEEDWDGEGSLTVETAVVGADRYLFSPGDYAAELLEYADGNDIGRVVLDPEYDPGGTAPMLRPLEQELVRGDVAVEEAPVERPTQRTVLARAGTLRKYGVVFVASFGFYLVLGEPKAFDVVTGAVTALITTLLLGPVAFGKQPKIGRLVRQIGRMVVYAPYLLWEIAKANVQIAYVVLHPSLPIDPEVVEFRAAVWGDAAVTTLANSITLTPGTLTVDVSRRAFTIHTLTVGAREDLFEGALERAVRFVFFGRAAARIPSPRERGDHRPATDEADTRATEVASHD